MTIVYTGTVGRGAPANDAMIALRLRSAAFRELEASLEARGFTTVAIGHEHVANALYAASIDSASTPPTLQITMNDARILVVDGQSGQTDDAYVLPDELMVAHEMSHATRPGAFLPSEEALAIRDENRISGDLNLPLRSENPRDDARGYDAGELLGNTPLERTTLVQHIPFFMPIDYDLEPGGDGLSTATISSDDASDGVTIVEFDDMVRRTSRPDVAEDGSQTEALFDPSNTEAYTSQTTTTNPAGVITDQTGTFDDGRRWDSDYDAAGRVDARREFDTAHRLDTLDLFDDAGRRDATYLYDDAQRVDFITLYDDAGRVDYQQAIDDAGHLTQQWQYDDGQRLDYVWTYDTAGRGVTQVGARGATV